MPEKQGRKYQVVTEAEIDLVLQFRDCHEFYAQYFRVFPDSRKDADSLMRIWKRRSEFAKKRQPPAQPVNSPGDLVPLLADQNEVLRTLVSLTRESLAINRQILEEITQQNALLAGNERSDRGKPRDESPAESPAIHHRVHTTVPEKLAPVMIAS